MSSKKATPRRKSKPPITMAKVSTVAKEFHEKNGTIASYSFVPDDDVQEIIRDVEKFSIRRSKNEDDKDSDETDDSTAVCTRSVMINTVVLQHALDRPTMLGWISDVRQVLSASPSRWPRHRVKGQSGLRLQNTQVRGFEDRDARRWRYC